MLRDIRRPLYLQRNPGKEIVHGMMYFLIQEYFSVPKRCLVVLGNDRLHLGIVIQEPFHFADGRPLDFGRVFIIACHEKSSALYCDLQK